MEPIETDEIDSHLCIRCKTTINGLENYLSHRKSSLCKPLSASAYFSHLRLQQKNKTTISIVKDDENENDDDDARSNHSSISDDDMYRPPRNFTGGKWKPGCGPDLARGKRYHITSGYSSDSNDEFDGKIHDKNYHQKMIVSCELETNPLFNEPVESYIKTPDYFVDKNKEIINNQANKSNNRANKSKAENHSTDAHESVSDNRNLRKRHSIDVLKDLIDKTSLCQNNDLIQVIDHENNLNKQLAFNCQMCNFYTNQSNNFIWHITRDEHKSKWNKELVLQCIVCRFRTNSLKSLLNHLEKKQTIHSRKSGPIIVCRKPKNSPKTINKQNICKKSECYKCEFCHKTFRFRSLLKNHTEKDHDDYLSETDLINNDTTGSGDQFSCVKCQFKTNSEGAYLLHEIKNCPGNSNEQKFDMTNKNTKYKCPRCNNSYNYRDLRYHIYIHTNEKPFECKDCGKTFAHVNYLRIHMKRHMAVRDQICEICGAGFIFTKSLKSHMEIHKTEREKKFPCHVCGSSHYTKGQLAQHIKRHTPKSDRIHKCNYQGCKGSFVHKNELQEHQLVHTDPDDKPLLCDQCTYKTKSFQSFRKHYRQHTGNKPYNCHFCNYTTALRSNLTRHLRVHTHAKPYQCPYCR